MDVVRSTAEASPAKQPDGVRVGERVGQVAGQEHPDRPGTSRPQRPPGGVRPGEPELRGDREDPPAQLGGELVGAVVGVGDRGRRDADRGRHRLEGDPRHGRTIERPGDRGAAAGPPGGRVQRRRLRGTGSGSTPGVQLRTLARSRNSSLEMSPVANRVARMLRASNSGLWHPTGPGRRAELSAAAEEDDRARRPGAGREEHQTSEEGEEGRAVGGPVRVVGEPREGSRRVRVVACVHDASPSAAGTSGGRRHLAYACRRTPGTRGYGCVRGPARLASEDLSSAAEEEHREPVTPRAAAQRAARAGHRLVLLGRCRRSGGTARTGVGRGSEGHRGPGPRPAWEPPVAPGPEPTAPTVAWTAVPFLVLLAASVTLRWRWPRAAFVASAVGVGVFFASDHLLRPGAARPRADRLPDGRHPPGAALGLAARPARPGRGLRAPRRALPRCAEPAPVRRAR